MFSPVKSSEQRALKIGMWANLLMGISGVVAAQLSRSDALMVDGLYSAVNFVSAIIAGRVAVSVMRRPSQKRPFGYEVDEALYVLFRSLVLLGILAFAVLSSMGKMITYFRGGEIPELVFGPIVVYTVSMAVICFGLAAIHGYYWKQTGFQSEILRMECSAAIVDGFISAGSGGALVGVVLLRGTSLEMIIPIADALIVMVLSLVVIGQPTGSFRKSLKEIAGHAEEGEEALVIRVRVEKLIEDLSYELLDFSMIKIGRVYFVVSYINPLGLVAAEDLDRLREQIHESYEDLFPSIRTEVVFTAIHPYCGNRGDEDKKEKHVKSNR